MPETSTPVQPTGRWIRRLVGVAALLGLLAATVWWGVPALLTSQLPPRLSQALGRPVTLTAVEFAPWDLALTVHGLRIGRAGEAPDAPASSPALLRIERLHADIAIASLRHGAPVVEAVAVDGLQLQLARIAPGHYDIDDLIQRLAALPRKAPGAEPARFSLNNLAVRGAQIHFDDRPAGQQHRVQALTLTLPFLSNLPDDVDIHTEPRLAFELNGTKFDSGTQALPFKESKSGALTLAFRNLDLKPALAYLPAGLPVRLLGAQLSSDLSLRFTLPQGGTPTVSVKGEIALRDVQVAEPGGAPLLAWQALTLQLTDVQPLQRRIDLGLLKVEGAELQVSRDARGQLNLQRLVAVKAVAPSAPGPAAAAASAPAASAARPAGGAAAASPWAVTLASLQLDGAKLRWTDDAVRPRAALQVDGLGLQVDGLRWPSPMPLPVKVQGQLRAQRADAPLVGRFSVDGQVHPQAAALSLQVDGFDLATLAPYLAQTLQPRLSGQVAAQATVEWAAEPAALIVKVDNAGVKNLQLRDATAPRAAALASLRQLTVRGVDLNLASRRVSIASLQLVQPAAAIARDAEGRFNVQQWLVAAPAAAAPTVARAPAAAGPPWQLALRDLSLTGGQLQWRDAAMVDNAGGGPVLVDVSDLKLRLQGLAWPAKAATAATLPRLQLAARVGSPATQERAGAAGDIDWAGRFGLAPMQVDGRLTVKRFPVHLFVPYAGRALPLHLQHADASYQGQVRAQATPTGWQVATEGDAQLTELQLNSRAARGQLAGSGTELLTWQSLSLQGLSLAMAPPARPQVVVREVTLDDFYSRLQITEDGRFNLQDVAAAPAETGASAPAVPAAPAATPATSPADRAVAAAPAAAAASGSDRLAVEAGQVVDLDIGGIQLRNGRVDFSDQFIRPNYSAQLTELNGSIGRLRSGTREMATIALRGRAAGTALLDISGQVNPTAKPLALDIRARATDLELAPLSPYAGRYAGYGIERGKLSVDVSYKIDADGKLDAKNQVTLNQLTFGDKVDSPSATKLPVLLAVSLLTDRNGVIDINLPVSGSVSDPKFSVGGIIWQVIVNLLTKAVTAPFALLSGGGGGPDLSVVQFQPGTAQLADAGRQSLAKVATALADRPALIMTVTGSADPVSERDASQRAALEARLQAERRRERLRDAPANAAGAATAAATAPASVALAATAAAPRASAPMAVVPAPSADPPLSADDRARLLKRLYQQTPLPDKPRNLVGLLRDLPPAEMEARLLAAMPVTEVTMRELALQRGLAVRDALIGSGLASDRLFLAAPKLRASGEGDAAWVPQVSLTLSNR